MSSKTRTLAIALSAVLVLSVLGTGAALAQDNSTVTETPDDEDVEYVTYNGTDAENGTDDGNESAEENETYDGTDDGEVNETEDGNETTHQPFGEVVSAFVHGLLAGSSNETNTTNATNDTDVMSVTNDPNMTLGQQIAAFVVANNPGNAPDHAGPGGEKGPGDAGPPEHAAPESNETGKPAHAGPDGNQTGKPDDVGPDRDEDASNDDDDEREGGPPTHAGGKGGR